MSSPLRRLVDWFFPSHQSIIRSYLAPDEVVVLDDYPAIGEFLLVRAFWQIFLLGALLLVAAFMFLTHRSSYGLVAFVIADVLLIRLFWIRLSDYYTRYVITDLRIIRTSGVFSRTLYSIPFGKITDVAYKQKFWERIFGYATIEIDSASEKSGLDRLRGLKDPNRFNNVLVAMLADKQGYVVPGSAAVNKMRSREDQIKLELRFNRRRPFNFPDPTDYEMTLARVAAVRDIQEKERGLRWLQHLKELTPDYAPDVAYPDDRPPYGGGGGTGSTGANGVVAGDTESPSAPEPEEDDD